ncbi:MAG: phage tail protein [Paraclostridium sp.]
MFEINSKYNSSLSSKLFNDKIHFLVGKNCVIEGFEVSKKSETVLLVPKGLCVVQGAFIASDTSDLIQINELNLDYSKLYLYIRYEHFKGNAEYVVSNLDAAQDEVCLATISIINRQIDGIELASKMKKISDFTDNKELSQIADKVDKIAADVGSIGGLETSVKDSIVSAVNSVQGKVDNNSTIIGDLGNLQTPSRDNVINSINSVDIKADSALSNIDRVEDSLGESVNEINIIKTQDIPQILDKISANKSIVGNLQDLQTTVKSNIVESINEVNSVKTIDIPLILDELETKLNTSDLPTSMPANGGNADTLQGRTASSFSDSGHKHQSSDIIGFSSNATAINYNKNDCTNVDNALDKLFEESSKFSRTYSTSVKTTHWTADNENYSCTVQHGLKTKGLIVIMIDDTTNESIMPVYSIVDDNNVKLINEIAIDCTVHIVGIDIKLSSLFSTIEGAINDALIAPDSTWSSSKINREVEAKANTQDVYDKQYIDGIISGFTQINDTSITPTTTWSSLKVSTELANKSPEIHKHSTSDINGFSTHGNHIPNVEAANNTRYLRNDNTWQTLPNANASAKGIVQLSDSISTSTSMAATPSTVKQVWDLALGKADQSHGKHVPSILTADNLKYLRCDGTWYTIPDASVSRRGVVVLSDSVSSTSTSYAATANAVKKAYDEAKKVVLPVGRPSSVITGTMWIE